MRNLEKETLLFLYSLGLETRSLQDPRRIMARVTRSLGRFLECSRCAYADVETDSDSFTIFEDYTDGCASSAGQYSLKAFGSSVEQQMHRGETLVVNSVRDELGEADGAAMFQSIGIQAIICCPLVKDGHLKAMMAVHQIESRRWSSSDVSLVEEVVERCWSTIERARAQQSAERAAQQFQALFDCATDAMILLQRSGHITLVNRQAERLLQTSAGSLIGRSAQTLRTEPDLQSILADLRQTDAELPNRARETDVVRCDGTRIPVEVTTFRIPSPDQNLDVLNLRDISERQRLERELEQSNRLETLGRLVGGVAHDFNNLMTAVVNTTGALQMADSRIDMSSGLQIIADAGLRAGKLTRQLLAFSRQQLLKPAPIRMNELISDLAPLLRQSMKPSDKLKIELTAGDPTVLADENQLLQVMLNLTVNASDAMLEGGTLTIRSTSDDDTVQLEFADTGSGIKRDDLKRIFDPFYTTKPADKGTGLGLATVYGIVKQSGGDISVTSHEGRGTTFRLTFPLIEAMETVSEPGEPESLQGRSILLVEDDESIRHVTIRLLHKHGLSVHAAASGEEGLLKIVERDGDIDLVITDIVMPGMSGAVMADRIREKFPTVPILFVSGFPATNPERSKCMLTEESFLPKPYTEPELVDAIQRLLTQSVSSASAG